MILETSVWVCWEPTKVLHCLVLCAMWGNQKQGMRMISTIFSCPTLGSRFACFIRWWVAPSACCARAHANCGKSDWDQIEQSMSTISTIVQFSPDLVLHVMGGAIHLPQELTPIVSRRISRNHVHGWAEKPSCSAGKFDRFKKWPLLVKLFILRLQPIAFTIFAICTVAITDFEASTK